MALEHKDHLAVLEDSDRRRRRKITFEIAARPLRCVDIGACKNRDDFVRLNGMLQGHSDCGTSEAGGASAYRVNDNHDGAVRFLNRVIDFLWAASLFDAETR